MIEKTYEKCSEASQMHIKKFIVSFPLLLACSIKVNDYNSDFVPEYIIPQLLLQWVNNCDGIDGIQYISNKTKYSIEPITFESETNVVIPPKKFSDIGHCPELVKTIKMTNPISYHLLEISNPTLSKIKKKSFFNRKNNKTIELLKGEKTEYSETKFGILEEKLNQMKTDYIDK